MLIKYLDTSLIGFNGGKNCNHESPELFLESYRKRLEQVLQKRAPLVGIVPYGPHKKWEIYFHQDIIKNWDSYYPEMLIFVKTVFFTNKGTRSTRYKQEQLL